MTKECWERTQGYLAELFGQEDPHLAGLMKRAVAEGLPDIAVNAEVGRLLGMLAALSGDEGSRLAVEVGTLAGYSGIWIARGLGAEGRLICLEPDPRHADFAERSFREAGLEERVEVRREEGIPALIRLAEEEGNESVDLIFIDAIKTEYPEYLRLARPLVRPGGILVADNVLGTGSYWIDSPPGLSENRDAVDRFNREVAADPLFEAVIVPLRQGLLVARRKRPAPDPPR
jgi:caffeoyl-CoA O-methyltransferase